MAERVNFAPRNVRQGEKLDLEMHARLEAGLLDKEPMSALQGQPLGAQKSPRYGRPSESFSTKSGWRLQCARQPAGGQRLHGIQINLDRAALGAFNATKCAPVAAARGDFSTDQGHASLAALAARPLYRGER